MNEAVLSDPILRRMKEELATLYGSRLKQVLLYGSRARGDYREDSDYDVLVVLEGPLDRWDEIHRLARLSDRFLWETIKSDHPIDVSFKPVTPEEVQARTGFMHNVRSEAIPL